MVYRDHAHTMSPLQSRSWSLRSSPSQQGGGRGAGVAWITSSPSLSLVSKSRLVKDTGPGNEIATRASDVCRFMLKDREKSKGSLFSLLFLMYYRSIDASTCPHGLSSNTSSFLGNERLQICKF